MVDKTHRGQLTVFVVLPARRHVISVAQYKAARVDKQFAKSFEEAPDVLENMAHQALENLRAERSKDLDPDQL